MKKCSVCGDIKNTDGKYCDSCGSATFVDAPALVCNKCKQYNAADSAFCANCGAKLDNTNSTIVEDGATVGTTETGVATIARQEVGAAANLDSVKCPYCNADISISAIFCNNCGKDVSKSNEQRMVKRAVCPQCGHHNGISEKYCSYCFADLNQAEIQEFAINYQVADIEEDTVLKQAVISSYNNPQLKQKICPTCNTINQPSEHYCYKCGTSLAIKIKRKYCYTCGASNNLDAKYCTNCKAKFDVGSKAETWRCSCGEENDADARYCGRCGKQYNTNNGGRV